MTNMRDFKTCTIGNLDLILSSVALMHVKAVEVAGQMIRGTGVRIPFSVDGVGTGLSGVAGAFTVVVRLVGTVEALATAEGIMPVLLAHLAGWSAAAAHIAAAILTTTAAVTAAATLPAATTTTMAIRSTCGRVPRRLDLADRCVALDAKLGADEICIEVGEAHRRIPSGDSGDERLVLGAERPASM